MSQRSQSPFTVRFPSNAGFYRALLDRITDGVCFVDVDRRIVFWNDAAYHLTGYKPDEMVGQYCPDGILCHIEDPRHRLCHEDCPLLSSLQDGESREVQVFLRHKLERRVPVTSRIEPIRTRDGSIVGAVQIFSDDSERQDARRRVEDMERLAFFDQVTELPNRRFVEMSLQTALSEFHVHQDPFGVLLIDIDRFKTVNDRFGHAAGDRVLKEVAMTLVGALRPKDLVGRWGGDEFVALVHHVNGAILRSLVHRCRAMVARTPFSTSNGEAIHLSISIGETLVRSSDSSEGVIQRADQLMYETKMNSGIGR